MDLVHLLQQNAEEIVGDAFRGLERSHLKNYEKAGNERAHQRLKALYVLTVRGVQEKNLGPMIAHAESIARERYDAGFDLFEVQTAFNVLEEAIWLRILRHLPPADFGHALGLVSTVLGAGKDALARTYVTLASKSKAPALNLQSLFTGVAGS